MNRANHVFSILVLTQCLAFGGLATAQADSVKTIHDGSQFLLPGYVLLQKYENESEFVWAPTVLNPVRRSRVEVGPTGELQRVDTSPWIHGIERLPDGTDESVYRFEVAAPVPHSTDLLRAQSLLRRRFRNATIVGPAPQCGVRLTIPTVSIEGPARGVPDERGLRVIIGADTQAVDGACRSLQTLEHIPVEIRAPLWMEPLLAHTLMGASGIPVPSLELQIPMKFTNRLQATVSVRRTLRAMHNLQNISGGLLFVTARVKRELNSIIDRLMVTGSIRMDIQSDDPETRAHFRSLLTEFLQATFLRFAAHPLTQAPGETPAEEGCQPGNTPSSSIPLSIDALAGGPTSAAAPRIPACIKVSLQMLEADVEDSREFHLDFNDVRYGTIRLPLRLNLKGLPRTRVDPRILEMMP